MPFQPPRSLLALDTSEPLPVYSPRQYAPADLDASSIHSSAPSYVSAAPSYHSSAPPSHVRAGDGPPAPNTAQPPSSGNPPGTQSQGLRPAPQYAAGFGNRAGSTLGGGGGGVGPPASNTTASDLLSSPSSLRSLYNVAEWVPATEGLQSRHYHNVAKRRVSEALNGNNSSAATRCAFPFLFSPLPEVESGGMVEGEPAENVVGRRHTAPNLSDGRANAPDGDIYTYSSTDLVDDPYGEGIDCTRSLSPGQSTGNNRRRGELGREDLAQTLPLSPHEDPDLVGEEAAARYRSQRLYRTYQQQENQSHESQSSLLSQDGSSRHQYSQPSRLHQYSSLIPPTGQATISMDRQRQATASPPSAGASPSPPNDRSASPNATNIDPSGQYQATMAPVYRRRATTTTEFEEALREQESRTWDFMLAQMASWEEREREWKRFKDYVDKRTSSRGGMSWVWANSIGGSGSGNGNSAKLKKTPKKWKSKVGLAT